MEPQIAYQRFSRILKFAMKVVNPYDETVSGVKLTRLYRFFIASNLSMILLIVAFWLFEDPGAAATTEAIAVALILVRSIFYMLMMITRHAKWQATLGKIVDERKSVSPLDEKSFALTVKYCNVEVRLLIIGFVVYWFLVVFCVIIIPILHLNDLRLPLNIYIPGLHFEGLGWKWFLNYTFQVGNILSFSAFFSIFVPLTLLLLNQPCLKVDEAALLVDELRKSLTDFSSDKPQSDETKAAKGVIKNVSVVDLKATTSSSALKKVVDEIQASTSRPIRKVVAADKRAIKNAEIKELIRRIAEMINSVNEWREMSQDLMQLSFLTEFLILSFSSSLCLFTITENVVESISMLLGLCCFLFQLFLYCWLGTRLDIRVEKFAASLYDIEWHEMNLTEQKEDLLLMLTMTQKIGGFDGVFKPVNFETFKEILNFSYKLFTFLKTIN